VDVYYDDLQRIVHLKDFHMRTTLKKMPAIATAKRERSSPGIRIVGLIAGIVLIAAMVMLFIKNNR
jgi:hypothetical protein